jgi:sugar O-acyltransferase (sialic acid O-acetyltransferase NeuD family)
MSREVVIFGIGQIAEVAHYFLTQDGGRTVAAFAVDQQFRNTETMLGLPVVDFEVVQETHPPQAYDMFIAVSFRQVQKLREAKFNEAQAKGYALTSHVSPRAIVWSGFKANPNTIIMEANVIQPYVSVGRNVTMWSGNHVGHHTSIGNHCFIASHAVISGNVTIGKGSFIGVNVTIRDNVRIGSRNVLGAGAVILGDTPDNAVFMSDATEMSKVPSNRLRSI